MCNDVRPYRGTFNGFYRDALHEGHNADLNWRIGIEWVRCPTWRGAVGRSDVAALTSRPLPWRGRCLAEIHRTAVVIEFTEMKFCQ